jgi:O6-methylguanine-DNA--protein-cysteine methyltransferase
VKAISAVTSIQWKNPLLVVTCHRVIGTNGEPPLDMQADLWRKVAIEHETQQPSKVYFN